MKERGILFSGPMVKAILDGSKTMTRRTVKDISARAEGEWHPFIGPNDVQTGEWFFTTKIHSHVIGQKRNCPYGQPGDHLWVRETWQLRWTHDDVDQLLYRADEDKCGQCLASDGVYYTPKGPWKPSMFMPRWASRITLEVVSVRVERLQDISEEDAMAEGLPGYYDGYLDHEGGQHGTPQEAYARLWDSLNAKKPGESWESNPFCWVIEFKRIGEGQK